MRSARSRPDRAPAGAYTVEFALVLLVFLALVFGMVETARIAYVYVSLVAATQRAAMLAAQADFTDSTALDGVRQQALALGAANTLILGGSIGPAHLKIDYLSMSDSPVTPSCPAANVISCAADPMGASCIRKVRVRLCVPGTDCTHVAYEPLLPLPQLIARDALLLPTFQSVAAAGTLGYVPGTSGSCP
ncbi:MAG: TadE/TadG family type IV pilus assembly protein [Telluria sp.]